VSTTFAMPDLGEGLDEGRIVTWLVSEGDVVSLNQPLVEVETAKATVEVPSPVAGRVARLHAAPGEDVRVGAALVTFDPADPLGNEPGTAPVAATPAVRKLAKELGVHLASVPGTGSEGRVTADDVRAAASARVGEVPGMERIALTPIRRAIAENLERLSAVPQVTTFRTVDCTALDEVRRELGVSPLPVVVAALAATVPAHPLINACWGGDAIFVSRAVHVGLAADTERGLVVPVLKDAASKGIAALAEEIRRLGEGARAGALGPEELTGATVAVSNTGSYGSEAGTPILSPGTAVTMAFGVVAPRALVVEGLVEARPAATISLTFDHRVLDGAAAGRALTDLVGLLQSHERLRDLPR
jgi:pyruvate/2-oxoglutarate dehydrogenase complex dihydrolipoamide acyltransferase (E2) component